MRIASPIKALAVAVLATVALAACSSNPAPSASNTPAPTTPNESVAPAPAPTEATVATATGDVTVPVLPERVVVFEHGILDTINTLGFADRVVGIPHHALPPSLESFTTSTENTGTLFEPDFETVNALNPDLIIVGGRSSANLPELEKIAPTIDLTIEWATADFLDSLKRSTDAIGAIFNVSDDADKALAALLDRGADLKAKSATAGNALVLIASGGEISAYGPDSRYDFVYGWLGFQPAAEQIKIDNHGDSVSYEFIAETNPDIIFVLDRDAAIGQAATAAKELLDNDLVNSTNAVKNNKVVYTDAPKWYLSFGGLTSMNEILDEVASVVE